MLYSILILACSVWTLIGVLSLRAQSKENAKYAETPVTVLKPLCGADEALEENLRTFFEQDHPAFELVFGVEGRGAQERDDALPIVRRLIAEHPHVDARVIVHAGESLVPNPKVRNLLAMMPYAAHDIVVISDSNISVTPSYLREMAGALEQENVELATSPIVGVGEASVGALVENLHINGFIAPSLAAAVEGGAPAVVGKSMAFRRSVLKRIGGLASVGHVLAEDLVLGKMFARAGFDIALTSSPVRNVVTHQTLRGFVARQARWGSLRLRLVTLPFLAEPISYPIFLALLAPLVGAPLGLAFAWAIGVSTLRDATSWYLLRGREGLTLAILCSPLRDVLALWAWCLAPLQQHIVWRGKRLRLGTGTRLYTEHPVP
ncbi:MAG: ceramide glucosyltransferase [Polyangiales bacterium]|jgi:ceramide glucosyltransferase